MRFRFAVLVAVTSVLTVASPVTAGPIFPDNRPVRSASSDWAFVQQQMYSVPLQRFVGNAATGDRWYDWTTDGCSAPLVGDTGVSFNFRDSCRRHDFGYRNLRLLERRYGSGGIYWNATARHNVDKKFLSDMKAHCRTRSVLLRPSCLGWAHTFYAAVRVGGGP